MNILITTRYDQNSNTELEQTLRCWNAGMLMVESAHLPQSRVSCGTARCNSLVPVQTLARKQSSGLEPLPSLVGGDYFQNADLHKTHTNCFIYVRQQNHWDESIEGEHPGDEIPPACQPENDQSLQSSCWWLGKAVAVIETSPRRQSSTAT